MIPLQTRFASARYAPDREVSQDAALFSEASLITEMLDALPDILVVLNAQRQVVFANEACLRILGDLHLGEVLGLQPGELLDCVHASEPPAGCGTTEACRQCGANKALLSSIRGIAATQECRIRLTSGDALDLKASAKPVVVNGQQFNVFALKDISDDKRRRALEKIFFHDVLNTAGTVSLCAEIIRTYPEQSRNVIEDMLGSTQRLIEEIRSQRDLTMAENGELKPRFVSVAAAAFVNQLAQQYERHPVAAERAIKVGESNQALEVMSDPALLGRVIGNMIKNALEAARAGETVTITCEEVDQRVVFTVHNPAFMPRDVQLQIFNRSFSTKGSGRGLGTYSMKLLSERYLGGRVWFEASADAGTTFYASYPLQPQEGATLSA